MLISSAIRILLRQHIIEAIFMRRIRIGVGLANGILHFVAHLGFHLFDLLSSDYAALNQTGGEQNNRIALFGLLNFRSPLPVGKLAVFHRVGHRVATEAIAVGDDVTWPA